VLKLVEDSVLKDYGASIIYLTGFVMGNPAPITTDYFTANRKRQIQLLGFFELSVKFEGAVIFQLLRPVCGRQMATRLHSLGSEVTFITIVKNLMTLLKLNERATERRQETLGIKPHRKIVQLGDIHFKVSTFDRRKDPAI